MVAASAIYDVFVPGKPKAQPRTRKGKYGNIYNPDVADAWKETIQAYFLQQRKKPILGAVSITAYFYFYSPSQKENRKPHTAKPDIDNLTKALLDALKVIRVYKDDCQVYQKSVSKYWTNNIEKEGMSIIVSEVGIF